jgi:hypothetical protein
MFPMGWDAVEGASDGGGAGSVHIRKVTLVACLRRPTLHRNTGGSAAR